MIREPHYFTASNEFPRSCQKCGKLKEDSIHAVDLVPRAIRRSKQFMAEHGKKFEKENG